MRVEPYVNFDGRCEEAIEFYKRAVGAKVEMLMRYNESPDPHPPGTIPPGTENKVMHAKLLIGDSAVMVSDGRCTGQPKFHGITLSISASTEAEVQRLFNALAEGGKIYMPLAKTFFSPSFGMVNDKFGVAWMVLVMP